MWKTAVDISPYVIVDKWTVWDVLVSQSVAHSLSLQVKCHFGSKYFIVWYQFWWFNFLVLWKTTQTSFLFLSLCHALFPPHHLSFSSVIFLFSLFFLTFSSSCFFYCSSIFNSFSFTSFCCVPLDCTAAPKVTPAGCVFTQLLRTVLFVFISFIRQISARSMSVC